MGAGHGEAERLITLEAGSAALLLKRWRSPQVIMKAKLLWNSWLHLVLAAMVVVQAAFLWWCTTYIVPIYQRFRYDGWLDGDDNTRGILSWAHSAITEIGKVVDGLAASWWLWAVLLAVAGVLFLRRFRSESKQLIGFSTLATAALGLTLVVTALSAAIIIPFVVAVMTVYTASPEQVVVHRLQHIDVSVNALERAIASGDWDRMQTPARLAAHGVNDLATMGAAAPSMLSLDRQQNVDRLRTSLKTAGERLRDVENAIGSKDSAALETAMERFRDEYPPMR